MRWILALAVVLTLSGAVGSNWAASNGDKTLQPDMRKDATSIKACQTSLKKCEDRLDMLNQRLSKLQQNPETFKAKIESLEKQKAALEEKIRKDKEALAGEEMKKDSGR